MTNCDYCDEPVENSRKYCSDECMKEMSAFKNSARYHWNKEYKESTRQASVGNQLKRKFGVSTEQYIEMLEKQAYRCAICGRHQEELDRRMAVDHDHDTGNNRELLCNNCNVGIGHLRDNPALIRKAAEYLEKHK